MKCKICGRRFRLKSENRYEVVKAPVGLLSLAKDTEIFECFDCPHCGCQNIVNVKEPGKPMGVLKDGE